MTKKEFTLEVEVLVDLDHGSTPFDIFQTVAGINELLEIVTETNRVIFKKVRHLVSGMFGKVLTSMGIFFLYTIFLN